MSCPLRLRHVIMLSLPKSRFCATRISSSTCRSYSHSSRLRSLSGSEELLQRNSTSLTAYSYRLCLNDGKFTKNVLGQRRFFAERVIKVPEMAESISEGTLKQWSKSIGDFVERDEEIATIETDKIDVSVNAPEAGVLKELLAHEEDTVTVGQDLAKLEPGNRVESDGENSKNADSAASEEDQSSPQSSDQKTAQASESKSPKTKSANEGKNSGQTSEAIDKEQSKHQSTQGQASLETFGKEHGRSNLVDTSSDSREERRVKMNRMRLRIAERLKQSQNTAASLTTFQKVDMHSLMDFRKQYKDEILKKTGVKLGFMSAFTRASVLAMKDIPAVNASIEGPGGGDTIVYRDYVDISVAVATEKGLVTPVVRNAELLDVIGIEKSIADLGKRARDNKLTIEDMAGGTFTISNGGVFGSLFGTPIINLPQTAVLGLHAINDEVVVVDGKFETRPIMYLALTYDHRLLDGREAVTFLVKVRPMSSVPRKGYIQIIHNKLLR